MCRTSPSQQGFGATKRRISTRRSTRQAAQQSNPAEQAAPQSKPEDDTDNISHASAEPDLFDELDTDGDGSLSRSEFDQYLQQQPGVCVILLSRKSQRHVLRQVLLRASLQRLSVARAGVCRLHAPLG